MKSRFRACVLAFVLVLIVGDCLHAASYTVRPLPVPTGQLFWVPLDINDISQVVGYAYDGTNVRAVFQDRGASPVIMDSLGGQQCYARAINNSGQIAGHSDTPGGQSYGCYWDTSGRIATVIHAPEGGRFGWLHGINDRGDAVGLAVDGSGQRRAVLAGPSGECRYIGSDPSWAYDINDAGQVAGVLDPGGGVLWDANDNRQKVFGGWANGVNNDGNVVGSGFYWSPAGGSVDLPFFAMSINDRNEVVGYTSTGWKHAEPYYWSKDLGTVTLPLLDGYTVGHAHAINIDGQIVGDCQYFDEQGSQHVVGVTWEPVPEPSAVITLAAGLISLGGMVRRRV